MTPPAAAAAPAVDPRRTVGPRRAPLSVPPRPRRVSGPVRRPARPRPGDERRATRPPQEAGLVLGLLDALGRVPRSRLLDRLIQGRLSIAFVAFALIGIVTMQLGLLKLNAGIGRALEHEALLQRENAALSIENSELAAGDRVELQAGRLGMGLTSPGDLRFLTLGSPPFEARRAAAALNIPVATSASAATAASPTGATGEGSSGASESETVAGGSGAAGGETSSATPASSASSIPSAASSVTAGETSTSEASSAASSASSTAAGAGAGETSGSAPASGVSAPPVSGPSATSSEGAAAASITSTGGGATAPSG
jgi:hypothetical protein